MKEAIKLSILTPDRQLFNGEIIELNTENDFGRFTILSNHIPMITTLVPSVTYFTTVDDKKLKVFTSTGILKVKNNKVEMLCDVAEWPEEIDLKRAEESKGKAETMLDKKEGIDINRAELKLKRSLMRIKAKS